MGGLVLGNYLSRHSEEARKMFTACLIISVPWDVQKGSISIEKPYLNSLLGKHLTSRLCHTLSKYEILNKSRHDIDFDTILKSKTIKEFDQNFTSKHFGYKDVDHYYSVATLHNKLDKISVPLLCLSAADDPFQPLEGEFFFHFILVVQQVILNNFFFSSIPNSKQFQRVQLKNRVMLQFW